MRELKFRAWSLYGSRFWYFDIHTGFNAENSDCFPLAEQFTGLQDKDGVDIYEGDIVDGVIHQDYSIHIGRVLYDYNGYRILTSTKSVQFTLTEKLTVIGNMHENPELLESVKCF
jgi:uncharacterized phage protein (TIGR01671 family)